MFSLGYGNYPCLNPHRRRSSDRNAKHIDEGRNTLTDPDRDRTLVAEGVPTLADTFRLGYRLPSAMRVQTRVIAVA